MGQDIVRGDRYRPHDANSRDMRDNGRFKAQVSEVERFLSQLDTTSDPGHWHFTGLLNKGGYGRFMLTPGPERPREMLAHRYAYLLFVGDIGVDDDGKPLTLDHLEHCLRTTCCRPRCLEPVTSSVNLERRHARRRAQNGAAA